MSERTKVRLARWIRENELPENLAVLAEAGHFDDYESPSATPQLDLMRALQSLTPNHATKELITLITEGEFDGTKEEGEAWFNSSDGMATIRNLLKDVP